MDANTKYLLQESINDTFRDIVKGTCRVYFNAIVDKQEEGALQRAKSGLVDAQLMRSRLLQELEND